MMRRSPWLPLLMLCLASAWPWSPGAGAADGRGGFLPSADPTGRPLDATTTRDPTTGSETTRDESSREPASGTGRDSPQTGAETSTAQPALRQRVDRGGSLLQSPPPAPPPLLVAADGERSAFEPDELLVYSTGMDEARRLQSELQTRGMRLLRRRALPGVGVVMSVFRLPEGVSPEEAWRRLQQEQPGLWTAPNHRYRPLGTGDDARAPAMRQIRWPANTRDCGRGLRLGMIDTPVDVRHPLLLGAHVDTISLLPRGQPPAPGDHGTAVASLLVGQGELPGLLPQARLLAVEAFRLRDGEVDSTAELLIRALDHLVQAEVPVINLSLGGPSNPLLEYALQRVDAKGIDVVAAAGNEGPGADPVYPAAYAAVLAVTAVDLNGDGYRKANRGEYVELAAPGVDVPVAAVDGGIRYRSGTSFAAPFVTAALAAGLSRESLPENSLDLGDVGRDPRFGWGLLQYSGDCRSR